ncbi:MAG: F0F1 ATP synthase subunit delta [Campylobacterales bacterium]|nr:F0F1 ATP synthase subunit delta [Campylobacterales bacterium]
MEELVAQRYAKAIFAINDSKLISQYAEIFTQLSNAFASTPSIVNGLNSPLLSDESKTQSILDALGKTADTRLINFIKILGENKRLALIPAIAKIVNAELQKEQNSYQGVIRSQKSLGKSEVTELEDALAKYTGSKISLTQETSDFEGLRVLVEDLGIEVNFSKQRVKEQLIDYINRSL